MKMNIKILTAILLVALGFVACEPYEDYIDDFDYSTVYFASQKPLRTVIARDEMKIEFGVALGGKRTNLTEEWAKFRIEEELLADYPGLTLLPETYYSLSDNETMTIPVGDVLGTVTLTLNKDLFTADTLSHLVHYALPVRVYETSADSILQGEFNDVGDVVTAPKDYTIIVIRYASPYSGFYYHKGTQSELDASGAVVSTTEYTNNDLSQNQVWPMTTIGLNSLKMCGLGNKLVSGVDNSAELKIEGSSVSMHTLQGSNAVIEEGSGSYDASANSITVSYKYTIGGVSYRVDDELVLRQAPELDLRYEEW